MWWRCGASVGFFRFAMNEEVGFVPIAAIGRRTADDGFAAIAVIHHRQLSNNSIPRFGLPVCRDSWRSALCAKRRLVSRSAHGSI